MWRYFFIKWDFYFSCFSLSFFLSITRVFLFSLRVKSLLLTINSLFEIEITLGFFV